MRCQASNQSGTCRRYDSNDTPPSVNTLYTPCFMHANLLYFYLFPLRYPMGSREQAITFVFLEDVRIYLMTLP